MLDFTEVPSLLEIVVPLNAAILLLVLLLVVLSVDLFTGPDSQRGVGIFAAVGMLLVILVDVLFAMNNLGNELFDGPVVGGMVVYDVVLSNSFVFSSNSMRPANFSNSRSRRA